MATGAPRQIGPYQIIEELGRGGMGVVYRAFDPAIGRPLAIKLLHMPHLAPDAMEEMRQRFAREAAAAGRLSHPGIVTLYQFGQDGDSQYLAMELVPGGSLESRIRAGEAWPARDAFRVLRQIADALDYAHAQGVVHRDIKPANVLVQPDSRVKVTDFGIARMAEETKTRTGLAMGTPSYMAPEQISGTGVDARADQFSLAVVAFRLFSGRLPFGGESEYAILYRIVNGEPASLAEANPGIPASADTVIRRALAKDPAARFGSCAEFVSALEAAVMAPDAVATAELTRRSVAPIPAVRKKARWGIWVGGAGLLALVVAGLSGLFHVREKQPTPAKSEQSSAVLPETAVAPPAVTDSTRTKVNPKDGLTYAWVEPGGDVSEGFWIGRTKVTQQAYQDVMGTNPSRRKGYNLPVESVSWKDARDYCKAVEMRLPTKAERTFAGQTGTIDIASDIANGVSLMFREWTDDHDPSAKPSGLIGFRCAAN